MREGKNKVYKKNISFYFCSWQNRRSQALKTVDEDDSEPILKSRNCLSYNTAKDFPISILLDIEISNMLVC